MEAFSTWQVMSLLGILGWLLFARLTSLTLRIRRLVQPFVASQVQKGTSFVLQVQRFTHPALDTFFACLSCIVSVPFYTTFLPILFWSGHCKLGRQMTLLMAFCDYAGNSIKDVVSAPRPSSPPVRRLTTTKDEKENAMEYGLPSSHTLNTVCLAGYFLDYIINNFIDADDWTMKLITVSLFVLLILLIGIGRIYLGMHTPVDIIGGGIFGIIILMMWLAVQDHIDNFVTSGKNVVYFWASLAFLLVFAYPTPEAPTPSFEFHVAFDGVALGIVTGINRTFSDFHHEMVPRLFGPDLGTLIFIKRIITGLPIILAVKFISKSLAKRFLPLIFGFMGIPIRSSNYIKPAKESAADFKPTYIGQLSPGSRQSNYLHKLLLSSSEDCYDVDTAIKLVQYAGLAWAVVELVPMAFQALGF